LRDEAGRVQGRLHLFCSLNRDAARYESLGEHQRAVRLVTRARKLERRPDAKILIKAIAVTRSGLEGVRPLGTDLGLAHSVQDAQTARALRTYSAAVARAREELRVDSRTATGHVTAMARGLADVQIGETSPAIPVPTDKLPSEVIGTPVTLRWAEFGKGILMTVEAAVDVPGPSSVGTPDAVPSIYPFVRPLHQPIAIPAGAGRKRALARSGRVKIDS